MKLPDLLGGEKSSGRATRLAAQDRAERLLAESFRLLSQLCSKVADLIETQRLQRQGYQPQGKWLERLDGEAGGIAPDAEKSSGREH
ncbi:MAG TPA: hypothetical protein VFA20_17995 [Myxococcaceae bacterium]|nr:hypothetical protein [Myxococcaceae bacterium]